MNKLILLVLTLQLCVGCAGGFNEPMPDDPNLASQWGLFTIGTEKVWELTKGGVSALGDTIVVAILDTGFDINHEDLKGNIWINKGEKPGDKLDNDQNGYIDDVSGWNFIHQNATHIADNHGSSVAGIIGAKGNNGKGILAGKNAFCAKRTKVIESFPPEKSNTGLSN